MDPVRAARGENTNIATEHIDSAWRSQLNCCATDLRFEQNVNTVANILEALQGLTPDRHCDLRGVLFRAGGVLAVSCSEFWHGRAGR